MRTIQVFPFGDFGEEVAGRLVELHGAALLSTPQLWSPSEWEPAALTVVASWREQPREFAFVDDVCRRTGRAWLPVVLEPRHVRVGPLVSPATAACYQCFLSRQYQHGLLTPVDSQLQTLFDDDPTLGASGHLPLHVETAVALVDHVLAAADESPRRTGDRTPGARLVRSGLSHLRLVESEVVPVTGCSRCGASSEPDASWRSLAALAR
ncbi:TOMM precursor leader peptide-binding protein [Frigoribacterium sp. 2-23]|uniref:TOMM precursor leader peptide-binding protein n=1 Tax=Frigoribacterium sp. 2-23 TaxID=3415006 RepID=UPI003C6EBDD3